MTILLSETKFKILEELSKKDETPTELAKILNISIPSIQNQLKDLERLNFIKKTKRKEGKTRPFTQYSIGKGIIHFLKIFPNNIKEKILEIDDNIKIHFNIWSISQKEFHYPIESFWWKLQEDINKIDAIAVFGSVAKADAKPDSDIDILILSKNKLKIDTKMISKKIFMIQNFTTDDFQNSFNKKSKFAQEVVKNMIIIYDPKEVLNELKKRTS